MHFTQLLNTFTALALVGLTTLGAIQLKSYLKRAMVI